MNWHICHKKNYFFCPYFRHISLCFYSNFDQESSLDAEFDNASKNYPHCILLINLTSPKTRNTWKNVMMTSSSQFFRYFLFLGQRGPSKVWSVGTCWMHNQIPNPKISPNQNLSKNRGIYVENTNTKSNFFLSSSKINQYYFIILTIILLFSLGCPF